MHARALVGSDPRVIDGLRVAYPRPSHTTRSSPICAPRSVRTGASAEPLELALYARDAGVERGPRGRGVLAAIGRRGRGRGARRPPARPAVRRAGQRHRARGRRDAARRPGRHRHDPDEPRARGRRRSRASRGSSPGVLNLDLTRAVAHLGLHYAPDPSSQQACTIGGNVAHQRGRSALPGRRASRRRTCSRSTSCSPTARVARLGGLEPDQPGYDLRGLLRRLGGHDGHRDPDRGAAHARPARASPRCCARSTRSRPRRRRSAASSRRACCPPRSR